MYKTVYFGNLCDSETTLFAWVLSKSEKEDVPLEGNCPILSGTIGADATAVMECVPHPIGCVRSSGMHINLFVLTST